MKNKLLTIIGAVALTLLLCASCILINGHYFKSAKDIAGSNTDWIKYIKDDTLLIDIAIPGSHDAGTCNMVYLGRTQGYSVKQQLDMGARYFDLRVNKTDDGYYMYHAMFNGERFEDVLLAISEFIAQNPSEVLILDFQHFKGDCKYDVVKMLEDTLVYQEAVVVNDTDETDLKFISSLKLGDVRGKCVILFGGSEDITKEYSFLFDRNNDDCTKIDQTLNSCYISEYNKLNSTLFIETALPYYYQNIIDKISTEGSKGLFVLQGQLTDGCLVFGPYSQEKLHSEKMTNYIKAIKNDPQKLSLTNIVMRDFLTSQKCEDIIALNYYKGIVSEAFKNDFEMYLD